MVIFPTIWTIWIGLPIKHKQGKEIFYKPISMQIENISIRRGNFILISCIINNIAILEATVTITKFPFRFGYIVDDG